MPSVLSSRQVASQLGCPFTFLDSEVRAGRIKPRLVAGRRVFSKAQLELLRKALKEKRKDSVGSLRRGKTTSKKKRAKRVEKI